MAAVSSLLVRAIPQTVDLSAVVHWLLVVHAGSMKMPGAHG